MTDATYTRIAEEAKRQAVTELDSLIRRAERMDKLAKRITAPSFWWMSVGGWVTAALLATYLIFMLSFHNTDHERLDKRLSLALTSHTLQQTEIEHLNAEIHRLTLLTTPKPTPGGTRWLKRLIPRK